MKSVVRPELSTPARCPLINRGLLFKRTEPLLVIQRYILLQRIATSICMIF